MRRRWYLLTIVAVVLGVCPLVELLVGGASVAKRGSHRQAIQTNGSTTVRVGNM
jgi:hypothetical protein